MFYGHLGISSRSLFSYSMKKCPREGRRGVIGNTLEFRQGLREIGALSNFLNRAMILSAQFHPWSQPVIAIPC